MKYKKRLLSKSLLLTLCTGVGYSAQASQIEIFDGSEALSSRKVHSYTIETHEGMSSIEATLFDGNSPYTYIAVKEKGKKFYECASSSSCVIPVVAGQEYDVELFALAHQNKESAFTVSANFDDNHAVIDLLDESLTFDGLYDQKYYSVYLNEDSDYLNFKLKNAPSDNILMLVEHESASQQLCQTSQRHCLLHDAKQGEYKVRLISFENSANVGFTVSSVVNQNAALPVDSDRTVGLEKNDITLDYFGSSEDYVMYIPKGATNAKIELDVPSKGQTSLLVSKGPFKTKEVPWSDNHPPKEVLDTLCSASNVCEFDAPEEGSYHIRVISLSGPLRNVSLVGSYKGGEEKKVVKDETLAQFHGQKELFFELPAETKFGELKLDNYHGFYSLFRKEKNNRNTLVCSGSAPNLDCIIEDSPAGKYQLILATFITSKPTLQITHY